MRPDDFAVRLQPTVVTHPRINGSEPSRQLVSVRIERREDAHEKRVERLVGEAAPAAREKVIEENVGDDARVVAVLGDEHAPERGDRRM